MSSVNKNWISIKNNNVDDSLAEKLKIPEIIIQLLANRDQITSEDVLSFLSTKPELNKLHDPGLLPNIQRGVDRLLEALNKNQKILIHGDYDTDGIISTAILYNFLKKSGADVHYFIPDRFEDGYDINRDFIVKKAVNGKFNIVICVDCGTNAAEVKELIESSETGIDVIVCDHHESVSDESAKTSGNRSGYIIINPKLHGSGYPFKYLSGAGVTFKFIIAALRRFSEDLKSLFEKDYLSSLLDLVALSVISDVMPIKDENRIIVKEGLKRLENTSNPGLKKLLGRVLEGKEQFSTYDIGFVISPRINASGRIRNAYKSLNLLLEDPGTFTDFDEIISDIEEFNKERQKIQQETFDEILLTGDLQTEIRRQKILIRSSPKWNEGVLGIVAADLVKKFNVPVLLFRQLDGKLKGSGRSIENFNLYSNLEPLKDYFVKFGGHAQACGITVTSENFDKFRHKIISSMSLQLKEEDIEKKYYYDMEICFDRIDFYLLNQIKKLEPFGPGNPRPLFLTV